MKYYILIILLFFSIGCNDTSIDTNVREEDCPKPEAIPEWVKWDCAKDEAYKNGDVYFNEDSTAFAWGYNDSV
jgi:hypothetical protein